MFLSYNLLIKKIYIHYIEINIYSVYN